MSSPIEWRLATAERERDEARAEVERLTAYNQTGHEGYMKLAEEAATLKRENAALRSACELALRSSEESEGGGWRHVNKALREALNAAKESTR